MNYVNDLHFFSTKLRTRMIEVDMVNADGEPDEYKLYNALYPNDQIWPDGNAVERQHARNQVRAVSNWIKGRNYPKTINNILELCNALNCDFDYFFTQTPAPTKDIQFVSETMGLTTRTIEKIKQYDDGIKQIINGLVCCNELGDEKDFFLSLMSAFYDYGLSAYDTSIKTKNIFNKEKEISDKERVRAMMKYPATEIFDLCLEVAPFILEEKRNEIHSLKIQLMDTKTKELKDEIQRMKSVKSSDME